MPDITIAEGQGRLRVVILSCGELGSTVATNLAAVPSVDVVALVTTPYSRQRLSLSRKLRQTLRSEGVPGLVRAVGRRFARIASPRTEAVQPTPSAEVGCPWLRFQDFHEPSCLATLRRLHPDLGVVVGTYILRPEVFTIPRLGSINLHMGKVPEYRGAAPAFWELYNGEQEVGVTIHWIETTLDAGRVIRQETYPLDPAPATDPVAYIEQYRRDTLRPQGVRLMVEAVAMVAAGQGAGQPQDDSRARTYRSPTYRDIRELRRRVRARRAELEVA